MIGWVLLVACCLLVVVTLLLLCLVWGKWKGHPKLKALRPMDWMVFRFLAFMMRMGNHWSGVDNKLQPLPASKRISSRVVRVLGLNPGRMTLQGTNTYLVGTGPSRILIDSGDGRSEYIELLKKVMKTEGVDQIAYVLLTHGHYDHMGGVHDIMKIWPDAKIYKHLPHNIESSSHVTNELSESFSLGMIEDGAMFQVEGATIRSVYTPGHTNDHMCFVLEEEKALFSGDCILGAGSCVFQDLSDYMKSLKKLEEMKLNRIFPGHGPSVDDAKIKILEYIKHRMSREEEIIAIMQDTSHVNPITSKIITTTIYKDIPLILKRKAEGSVIHHLEKLRREGKVSCKRDSFVYGSITWWWWADCPRNKAD